jgi:amino-acid N-acetyltransferase
VEHCYRKRGIAENLLKAVLDFASEHALATIYLLTDTAESYFAQRGFIHIERAEIPEPLLSNSGLGCVCSCCSTAMKMGR